MKKLTCQFLLMVSFTSLYAQYGEEHVVKLTEPIVKEGKAMYRSEMASWYGTDIFLEAYKNRQNIGGYFSYPDKDITKCVFFSKTEVPKVIGTISFDSTYSTATAKTDLGERDFSAYEKDIYLLRKAGYDLMRTDTFFKHYENSNLNLIPMTGNGEKRVYFLTGPEKSGWVIFGNDYLVTFDDEYKVKTKKMLHRNIIPIEYGKKPEDANDIFATLHSHKGETGDLITATDICTLMLYAKFAGWQQHYVVSEKFVGIWDCGKETLLTLTREAWDKINAHQKEKKNN
ncbi:MAG TPA: hypothetical protein PKJ94_13105 [Ferruginibacter sp.]|nr:hypothetical protein [Ferruginibacter sp.]